MARSNGLGMATFGQSLDGLYRAGKISLEQAVLNADSRTDLKLRIKLAGPAAQSPWLETEQVAAGEGSRK